MKASILILALVFLCACTQDPLSRSIAERDIAQACSNGVVGISRIVRIQHDVGATNATVIVEHVNEAGGIVREEFPLVYTGAWQMDAVRLQSWLEEAKRKRVELANKLDLERRDAEMRGMALAEKDSERQIAQWKAQQEATEDREETELLKGPIMIRLTTGKQFQGQLVLSSASDSGIQVKTSEGEYKQVPWQYFYQSDLEKFAKCRKLKPFLDGAIKSSY